MWSKTRRGGGRNSKNIKMQNSIDVLFWEEIQDARVREMKMQKCMSMCAVLLIRSSGVSRCEIPAGRPALDFFAGVTSLDVLASENEAVLVVAGVWCRKERENIFW